MDNILEVKNLKISFRTPGGILKAVRDINFNLVRGETLAIVGESGSGKSVTSRAILGILAGNSIVESGEILYDGKNLLTLPEDDMHKIRGDKISMIFQDPLSSLNPIVKIGKQITEAMLLKNKINRKEAKRDFNEMLSLLKSNMIAAANGDSAKIARINELIDVFDKFTIRANELENSYNTAFGVAEETVADIDEFFFLVEKHQKPDVKQFCGKTAKKLAGVKDQLLTAKYDALLKEYKDSVSAAGSSYKETVENGDLVLSEEVKTSLNNVSSLLKQITSEERPNFFRLGYYNLMKPEVELGKSDIKELNEEALTYLDGNFMNEFIALEKEGIKYSFDKALEYKKAVVEKISSAYPFFSNDNFTKAEANKICDEISDLVDLSIDKLETIKDSVAYTFRDSMREAIKKYFYYKGNNPKEEARFEKQSAKRQKLIDSGKKVDWKVVPKNVLDLSMLRDNIISVMKRLDDKYTAYINGASSVDFDERAVRLINYFKEKASQVVYKVTKSMAKEKAIKLMQEVGIPEPRTRFYQYPFEFSGGMRQRIVIAIALSANPDILICDEPTTALDVTIQAQILELINKLKRERNLSVIFITHDLGVVANMADKIAVMYAGKVVEYGTADDIFYDPRHPYTWALLSSMPDLDTNEKLDAIPGTPPNMLYPPVGDAFADRNKYALNIDFEEQPPVFPVSDTHWAATWLLHPDAPKVEIPKQITARIERMMKKSGGANNES